jgi:hypothetical protein
MFRVNAMEIHPSRVMSNSSLSKDASMIRNACRTAAKADRGLGGRYVHAKDQKSPHILRCIV